MRIGLLGGTFDPIHNAHVAMAKYAKKQLGLDEVWFLVAKDTPLKDRKISRFEDRCNMVALAIAAYEHFKVCAIEALFTGKSYTIDSVRYLKQQYPKDTFYFMIGADQVAQLHLWKGIDCLVNEVNLCAFARPGNALESAYPLTYLQMPLQMVSSTQIREGQFLHIHPNVRAYIWENLMYMNFLQKAMSAYRYEHSLRVANLCAQIAKKQNLDVQKAYLCGLLHDINKEFKCMNIAQTEMILTHMRPHLLKEHKDIWHGYSGRFICEHQLYIKDNDILIAIENHVLGECRNVYAMLLYVSDKLEPGRNYPVEETIRICEKNLYEGYLLVRKEQKEFYGEINDSRE